MASLTVGPRTVDLDTGRVSRDGRPEGALRPKELALLRSLARRPGAFVPLATLLDEVWGAGPDRAGTLYSTLRRLRMALEPDPSSPAVVISAPGRGVRLAVPAPAVAPGVWSGGPTPRAIGRDAERARIAAGGRWVTICGPPGVGKTHLARAAAPQAQWVALRGATDPEAAIAAAFGLDGFRWRRAVARAGPTTLVLDDADDATAIVAQALASAPELVVIATARAPLGGDGEAVVTLGPLAEAEARHLLDDRVGGPVAEAQPLLDALGGVPAAIVDAAPLVASVGAPAALALLRADPDGPAARAARQWYDALSPELRGVVHQVVVFRSMSLAGAGAVIGDLPRWLPEARRQGVLSAVGPDRFAPNGLLRAFVAPDPGAVERHRAWYAARAAEAVAAGGGGVKLGEHDALEVDDWLAAAESALDGPTAPPVAELLEVAARFAVRADRRDASRALVSRALTRSLHPAAAVRLEALEAEQALGQGRLDDARRAWAALPERALREGLPELAASIELLAASEAYNATDQPRAAATLDRAARWAREVPGAAATFRARFDAEHLHLRALLSEDDRDAEAAFDAMVRAARVLDRPDLVQIAHHALAQVRLAAWRPAEAERLVTAALGTAPQPWAEVALRCVLAEALVLQDRPDEADRALAEAHQRVEGGSGLAGAGPRVAWVSGRVAFGRGDLDGARASADRTIALARAQGQPRFVVLGRALAALAGAAEDGPTLFLEALARGMPRAAVGLFAQATAAHLLDGGPDPDWMFDRLVEGPLGSAEIELVTVMAERSRPVADLRAWLARLAGPRVAAMDAWLAAAAGERVRPTYVDTVDPWVAVYQARVWRSLGRTAQVAAELARVRPRGDRLLARAVADLTGV